MTSPTEIVLDAFAQRRLIDPLTDGDDSLDEKAAYAIAREVHARRIQRGENPVGRKIGFTNRAAWSDLNVRAPIWGHVYDSTVHHAAGSNHRLSLEEMIQPRIEPEIQLHFARTPPATQDEDAILECIDWIALGYEIVQCPYPDWKFQAPDAIAAFGLHGALVVGIPVAVTDIGGCVSRLREFTVQLSLDGVVQAGGGGADVLGSPLSSFAWFAEVLAGQPDFAPVQAGETITTGTLTAAKPVAPGQTWSTAVDGIDLPGVSISFE